MKSDSPWDGLPIARVGSLEARRADAEHPRNFFYARNAVGDFLFTLQVTSDACLNETLPRPRGIEIEWLRPQCRLQLRLLAVGDQDMFAVLCRDLLAATISSRSDAACLDLLLGRLARWQRLLGRGQTKLLSEEQIRGLVGELLFLRDELMPRFGPGAVLAWKGPQGFPQDFAIDGIVIEVKSHLVGAPSQVKITSPEQLWADGAKFYLRVQRLAMTISGGLDLVSLVGSIAEQLAQHSEELASFELSLREVGYHDAPEYKSYRMSSEGADTYFVGEGFPRIDPLSIPEGVCAVSYSLKIPSLEVHRSGIKWDEVEVTS